MPSNPAGLPDGVTAVVCTRGRKRRRCVYCEAWSTRLCDYPFTGPKAGKTCDAAMCDRHTHRINELDYCRAHKEALQLQGRKP